MRSSTAKIFLCTLLLLPYAIGQDNSAAESVTADAVSSWLQQQASRVDDGNSIVAWAQLETGRRYKWGTTPVPANRVVVTGSGAESSELELTTGLQIELQAGSSWEFHYLTLLLPPLPAEWRTSTAPSLLAHVFGAAAPGPQAQQSSELLLQGVTVVAASCEDLNAFVKTLCSPGTWAHTTDVQVYDGVITYTRGSMSLLIGSAAITADRTQQQQQLPVALLRETRFTCAVGGGSGADPSMSPPPSNTSSSSWPCMAAAVEDFEGLSRVMERLPYTSMAVLVSLTRNISLESAPASWAPREIPTGCIFVVYGAPNGGGEAPTQIDFAGRMFVTATDIGGLRGSLVMSDLLLVGLPYPTTVLQLGAYFSATVWAVKIVRTVMFGSLEALTAPLPTFSCRNCIIVIPDTEAIWWHYVLSDPDRALPYTHDPIMNRSASTTASSAATSALNGSDDFTGPQKQQQQQYDVAPIHLNSMCDNTWRCLRRFTSVTLMPFSLYGGNASPASVLLGSHWPAASCLGMEAALKELIPPATAQFGNTPPSTIFNTFCVPGNLNQLVASRQGAMLYTDGNRSRYTMRDAYVCSDCKGGGCTIRGPLLITRPKPTRFFWDLRGQVDWAGVVTSNGRLNLQGLVLFNLATAAAADADADAAEVQKQDTASRLAEAAGGDAEAAAGAAGDELQLATNESLVPHWAAHLRNLTLPLWYFYFNRTESVLSGIPKGLRLLNMTLIIPRSELLFTLKLLGRANSLSSAIRSSSPPPTPDKGGSSTPTDADSGGRDGEGGSDGGTSVFGRDNGGGLTFGEGTIWMEGSDSSSGGMMVGGGTIWTGGGGDESPSGDGGVSEIGGSSDGSDGSSGGMMVGGGTIWTGGGGDESPPGDGGGSSEIGGSSDGSDGSSGGMMVVGGGTIIRTGDDGGSSVDHSIDSSGVGGTRHRQLLGDGAGLTTTLAPTTVTALDAHMHLPERAWPAVGRKLLSTTTTVDDCGGDNPAAARCLLSALLLSFAAGSKVEWYSDDAIFFSSIQHLGWSGERVLVTSRLPGDFPAAASAMSIDQVIGPELEAAYFLPPPPPNPPPAPRPTSSGGGGPLSDVTRGGGDINSTISNVVRGGSSSGAEGPHEQSQRPSWAVPVAAAVSVGVALLAASALLALWLIRNWRRRRAADETSNVAKQRANNKKKLNDEGAMYIRNVLVALSDEDDKGCRQLQGGGRQPPMQPQKTAAAGAAAASTSSGCDTDNGLPSSKYYCEEGGPQQGCFVGASRSAAGCAMTVKTSPTVEAVVASLQSSDAAPPPVAAAAAVAIGAAPAVALSLDWPALSTDAAAASAGVKSSRSATVTAATAARGWHTGMEASRDNRDQEQQCSGSPRGRAALAMGSGSPTADGTRKATPGYPTTSDIEAGIARFLDFQVASRSASTGPVPSLGKGTRFAAAADLLTSDDSASAAISMPKRQGSSLTAVIHRMRAALADGADAEGDNLQLICVLGRGTFGVVYLASWHGLQVAVKTVVIHDSLIGQHQGGDGARRRQRAVMEAAVSSSMTHPNIVQTYAYEIKNLEANPRDNPLQLTSGGGSGQHKQRQPEPAADAPDDDRNSDGDGDSVHQLFIIQEFCEAGTIKEALAAGLLTGVTAGGGNLALSQLALCLALDVARGMYHIHCRGIVHGDLSSTNVLLSRRPQQQREYADLHDDAKAAAVTAAISSADGGGDGGREGGGGVGKSRGADAGLAGDEAADAVAWRLVADCWRPQLVAKVTDFGLSVRMGEGQTHASNRFQGTPTHTAPEVLTRGQLSMAADVYSFGVLLLELVCGNNAEALLAAPSRRVGPAVARKQQQVASESPSVDGAAACVGGAAAATAAAGAGSGRSSPSPLATLVPEACPERLRALISSCLELDREARPGFGQVVAALGQAVKDVDTQRRRL